MINVKLYRVNGKIHTLEIKGHANSAECGKDLVCSAVSAVSIGGLNNIQNPKSFDIKIKDGYISVDVINEISNHDEIVIETIITSLKTIEVKNKDYIRIQNFES